MPDGIKLEGFEGHLVDTLESTNAVSESERAFRVALLGDWSGRASRGLNATNEELASWRPRLVDRDNLEEVMAKLGVALKLSINDTPITLSFDKLDHFHPDLVFEMSDLFQALRRLRTRLSDPKTFADAAREMRPQPDIKKELDSAPAPQSTQDSEGSLLDQILAGKSSDATAMVTKSPSLSPDLQSLVQEIVRPHLLPDDSEQESLIASVDKAIGQQMRNVLHDPTFQSLESAWRALSFLVDRLDTGVELKLYLLDISKGELRESLFRDNTHDSGLHKLLVDGAAKTFGGEPWSMIVGNYAFNKVKDDAQLLKQLANVAKDAGCAFVSAAAPRVVGCDSFGRSPDPDDWTVRAAAEDEASWTKLRESQGVDYLGLVAPRFLLRLPYGNATEPIEAFDFEEMETETHQHEDYLWVNGAFAFCYLTCQAFLRDGWQFEPGSLQEIEGLPLHVYEIDGETTVKPCAEILMTVEGAGKMVEAGVMPLISMKGTDAIRLGLVESLAHPQKRLAGSWN